MAYITFKTMDGEVFKVDKDVASMCISIGTMLENLGPGGEDEVIPLLNIRGPILKKVIEWCVEHQNKKTPPKEEDFQEGDESPKLSSFEAKFVDELDRDNLLECIVAANFLDVPGLLKLLCRQVAKMLMGKTPAEIREEFSIEDTFEDEDKPDEEAIGVENVAIQQEEDNKDMKEGSAPVAEAENADGDH